jgi:hypothetical protein
MSTEQPREKRITVEAIFGAMTREPLINIILPDGQDRLSLHPDEARALALNLFEAAEASLADGFLMDFFGRELKLTLHQSAAMMFKYRGYRTRNAAAGT